MPEPDWLEGALYADSPSSRLKAASWMKRNPDVVPVGTLMRVMQREPVPQIRQVFNDVLKIRETMSQNTTALADASGVQGQATAIPELARLIRHELSPPIGWIRRAGNKEVPDFRRSRTSDAISRLERRIDALISLIKSEEALDSVDCDLETLLRDSWPDPFSEPTFRENEDSSGTGRALVTDPGLLEMLLANVYQNAIDASIEVPEAKPVDIAWAVVGERFWVRVSNQFAGTQFEIDDVEATGISTKSGHQGIGIALIKTAASRLNLGFQITGRSGIATFTLTGSME